MMGRWMQLLFVFLVVQGYSCRAWKGLSQVQSTEPSCPDEDGFYTVNNQCAREYYYCQGGVFIYEQQCPESNVFDPYLKTCVNANSCFDCPPQDGIHPIPQACTSEYFQCTNGIPEKLACPVGNVFDPVTYECTPAEQASCAMSLQCSENGYYPYPGECSGLYFLCVEGESFTMYCPSDTVFEASTSTCVPLESASCTRNWAEDDDHYTTTGNHNHHYDPNHFHIPYPYKYPTATRALTTPAVATVTVP
ncbi:putative Obstructor-J [Daphnia magna]|uniref:Putative Obstructor-J n=1 Tax=Daphnia magna TaxID=35525 RepID=A0A162SR82_9CRUS|nr:putative Obstructor-J [Daphnia magna]